MASGTSIPTATASIREVPLREARIRNVAPAPAATPADRPAVDDRLRCAICGGTAADWREINECGRCDRLFHLHLQQAADPADDCGAVVAGQACGWTAYCNDCLDEFDAQATALGHPTPVRLR